MISTQAFFVDFYQTLFVNIQNKFYSLYTMSVAGMEQEIFTGDDALSRGVMHAMNSDEGVGVIDGMYSEEDVVAAFENEGLRIASESERDEVFKYKLARVFMSLCDEMGIISEEAKQAIIDKHLSDFPIKMSTSDIGLMRAQALVDRRGEEPHIDQNAGIAGNWLPPDLYTGVSICVPYRGSADWIFWPMSEYAVLLDDDDYYEQGGSRLVSRAKHPDDLDQEVNPDNIGLHLPQDVGRIIALRHQDVLHQARQTDDGPQRLRCFGDITLMIDPEDLELFEILQCKEWAQEQRNRIFAEYYIRSAIQLEPAQ